MEPLTEWAREIEKEVPRAAVWVSEKGVAKVQLSAMHWEMTMALATAFATVLPRERAMEAAKVLSRAPLMEELKVTS